MLICFRLVVLALFYLSIATNNTHQTVIFPILKIIVLVVFLLASHFRNKKISFCWIFHFYWFALVYCTHLYTSNKYISCLIHYCPCSCLDGPPSCSGWSSVPISCRTHLQGWPPRPPSGARSI
jgi:hypothetical protein